MYCYEPKRISVNCEKMKKFDGKSEIFRLKFGLRTRPHLPLTPPPPRPQVSAFGWPPSPPWPGRPLWMPPNPNIGHHPNPNPGPNVNPNPNPRRRERNIRLTGWSRDQISFLSITSQGSIFTLRHVGWFGISEQKYVDLEYQEILRTCLQKNLKNLQCVSSEKRTCSCHQVL